MEDNQGKLDEVIEQMKLMNVLLSKHDKREETKANRMSWMHIGPRIFLLFLFLIAYAWFLAYLDDGNTSHAPPMNGPSSQGNKYSLLHAD